MEFIWFSQGAAPVVVFADASATEIAAWWGAIVASIVLLWDIFKWTRTGPQIALMVRPNMFTQGHADLDGKRLFLIDAANIGDRATTLTNMMLYHYPSFWKRLCRKPEYFFVKNPGLTNSFPHKLESGETWNGFVHHTDDSKSMLRNGYLYCALSCSTRKNPVTVRIRPVEPIPDGS